MNPTPIPPSDIVNAVKQTVDVAFNQGLVGAVLIFMLAIAIISVAILVYVIRRPNVLPPTPTDPIAGTNNAINALAESITAGNASNEAANRRIDAILEAQKQKDVADRLLDKEMNERYIESISAQADATNNLVDVLKQQGADSIIIRDDLHTMKTEGSRPLNELIQRFDEITNIVVSIKETSDNDHKSFEKLLADVADMKAIVIRLEAKRATSEINKVELSMTNPLPVTVESGNSE